MVEELNMKTKFVTDKNVTRHVSEMIEDAVSHVALHNNVCFPEEDCGYEPTSTYCWIISSRDLSL